MSTATASVLAALGAAALTGVAQYFAAVVPARRSAREARAANEIAHQQLVETRAENARSWLTHLDEMCRSGDDAERRVGQRLLRGTVKASPTDPTVLALLDELTQEHLGTTLDDTRQLLARGDGVSLAPPDGETTTEVEDDGDEDDQADA